MRYYPFLVRLVQIGELKLGLGMLKPFYMLEIMNRLHIDFLGKVIENLGGRFAWSTIPCLAKLLRKFNNLKDPTIFVDNALQVAFILIILLGIILMSYVFLRVILKRDLF